MPFARLRLLTIDSYGTAKIVIIPEIDPLFTMSPEARNRPRVEHRSRTCDTCKFRHQKCNGAKPTCHHCASRGLQCNYSNTKAHKISSVDIRRKVLAPQSQGFSSPSLQQAGTLDTDALAIFADNRSVVFEILAAGLVRDSLSFIDDLLITEINSLRAIRD